MHETPNSAILTNKTFMSGQVLFNKILAAVHTTKYRLSITAELVLYLITVDASLAIPRKSGFVNLEFG